MGRHFEVAQPKTDEARIANALLFQKQLGLNLPMYVDPVEDELMTKFGAHPEACIVIESNKVVCALEARGGAINPNDLVDRGLI